MVEARKKENADMRFKKGIKIAGINTSLTSEKICVLSP